MMPDSQLPSNVMFWSSAGIGISCMSDRQEIDNPLNSKLLAECIPTIMSISDTQSQNHSHKGEYLKHPPVVL